MPTYVYQCSSDGCQNSPSFEVSQKISEDSLKTCPACGKPVQRLISGGSFQLKGSGWYKTDYASSTTNGSSPKKSSSESAEKNTAPEPAKPAGGCCGGGCKGHS